LEPFESWYEREYPRMVATLLLATGDVDVAAEGVDEALRACPDALGVRLCSELPSRTLSIP
jgi:predicted RNA polymerase sigma factor